MKKYAVIIMLLLSFSCTLSAENNIAAAVNVQNDKINTGIELGFYLIGLEILTGSNYDSFTDPYVGGSFVLRLPLFHLGSVNHWFLGFKCNAGFRYMVNSNDYYPYQQFGFGLQAPTIHHTDDPDFNPEYLDVTIFMELRGSTDISAGSFSEYPACYGISVTYYPFMK